MGLLYVTIAIIVFEMSPGESPLTITFPMSGYRELGPPQFGHPGGQQRCSEFAVTTALPRRLVVRCLCATRRARAGVRLMDFHVCRASRNTWVRRRAWACAAMPERDARTR